MQQILDTQRKIKNHLLWQNSRIFNTYSWQRLQQKMSENLSSNNNDNNNIMLDYNCRQMLQRMIITNNQLSCTEHLHLVRVQSIKTHKV